MLGYQDKLNKLDKFEKLHKSVKLTEIYGQHSNRRSLSVGSLHRVKFELDPQEPREYLFVSKQGEESEISFFLHAVVRFTTARRKAPKLAAQK